MDEQSELAVEDDEAAFDVNDLGGAYLSARRVHRRVVLVCAISGVIGTAILVYMALGGATRGNILKPVGFDRGGRTGHPASLATLRYGPYSARAVRERST